MTPLPSVFEFGRLVRYKTPRRLRNCEHPILVKSKTAVSGSKWMQIWLYALALPQLLFRNGAKTTENCGYKQAVIFCGLLSRRVNWIFRDNLRKLRDRCKLYCSLIGSRIWAIDWYQNQWLRMTFEPCNSRYFALFHRNCGTGSQPCRTNWSLINTVCDKNVAKHFTL